MGKVFDITERLKENSNFARLNDILANEPPEVFRVTTVYMLSELQEKVTHLQGVVFTLMHMMSELRKRPLTRDERRKLANQLDIDLEKNNYTQK
jgi:hypothetical protein